VTASAVSHRHPDVGELPAFERAECQCRWRPSGANSQCRGSHRRDTPPRWVANPLLKLRRQRWIFSSSFRCIGFAGFVWVAKRLSYLAESTAQCSSTGKGSSTKSRATVGARNWRGGIEPGWTNHASVPELQWKHVVAIVPPEINTAPARRRGKGMKSLLLFETIGG